MSKLNVQFKPAKLAPLTILNPRPALKAPAPYFVKPAPACIAQDGSRPAEFDRVAALAKASGLSHRAARLKLIHSL